MPESLPAKAEVTIKGSVFQVWDALVNPDKIKRYMFGAEVVSDWKVGSPIVWKGEWKGKPFEDKGRILEIQQGKRLRYSHFSPLSGQPDRAESYHTVTIQVEAQDGEVHVDLFQDNPGSEKAREESRRNWSMVLEGLKKTVEAQS
ncbi:MAG TPA: SRPBCC domain-containing protein [Polyangia bacterium]|jgi:uncharacterized protein YndB with AHSA1/START domain|nr:SRPBCC domain-containing protein [Polyangia bacterium]